MSIQIAIPEVTALKNLVEQKSGLALKTHNHFLNLVYLIEKALGEHMSETTLERVWQYSTRVHTSVSVRTLDVLCQYIGFNNWEAFCDYLKHEAKIESEMFQTNILSTESLQPGDRLRIGWQPNRVCIIRYLGNYRFVAESTENTSLQPGDSFACLQFQLHRELFMDYFRRKTDATDTPNVRYAVGQEHGLTILEKLKP